MVRVGTTRLRAATPTSSPKHPPTRASTLESLLLCSSTKSIISKRQDVHSVMAKQPLTFFYYNFKSFSLRSIVFLVSLSLSLSLSLILNKKGTLIKQSMTKRKVSMTLATSYVREKVSLTKRKNFEIIFEGESSVMFVTRFFTKYCMVIKNT